MKLDFKKVAGVGLLGALGFLLLKGNSQEQQQQGGGGGIGGFDIIAPTDLEGSSGLDNGTGNEGDLFGGLGDLIGGFLSPQDQNISSTGSLTAGESPAKFSKFAQSGVGFSSAEFGEVTVDAEGNPISSIANPKFTVGGSKKASSIANQSLTNQEVIRRLSFKNPFKGLQTFSPRRY